MEWYWAALILFGLGIGLMMLGIPVAIAFFGTNIVAVMRWSCTVCMNFSGSKPGRTVSEPPLSRVGVKNAAPACESGVQIRNRTSSGHCHSDIWI